MTRAAEHLLEWLTPERRKLINALALDRLAERSLGTLSRFLKGDPNITFKRVGLREYYPYLRLIGYLPPDDIWKPDRELTEDEMSTDLLKWFTPLRRQIISQRAVDILSKRPVGVLNRYINGEQHITFKIIGKQGYYPTLELLGFVPPEKTKQHKLNCHSSNQFSIKRYKYSR